MRLTRLTLKNWKNFREADFAVQDRMFVVGPNGSGKSNLLDALRFLNEITSPGGGLQEAVERRGGFSQVRCLAARSFNHGYVTVGVGIGDSDPGEWIYELTFAAEAGGKRRPVIKRETVRHSGKVVLERPTTDDMDDPELLTQTHLEQLTANRDFRNVAFFLQSIRYRHIVPQLIRNPGRFRKRSGDPYGSDFVLRVANMPERTRRRRLDRINAALKVVVPQFDRLEPVRDEFGRWHLNAGFQHWRPRSAAQDETEFSDGSLRMLGLFWSLLERGKNRGPLLLEEPELTLHESVVKRLPGIFSRLRSAGGSQVFLTTHSRELLSDEGIELDETVVVTLGGKGATATLVNSVPHAELLLRCGVHLADIVLQDGVPRRARNLSSTLVGA